MKSQTVLTIGIALLLVSCGNSNENDYAISRLADMMTVYWCLPANTEIANFELKNNVLKLEINTGRPSEKQALSIPIQVENNETPEINGISRLDELAIFHITVHPMMEAAAEIRFKTHIMWKWIDGKWQEAPQIVPFECDYNSSRPDRYLRHFGDKEKPGNFTRAETFRSGDRITAYWHIPSKPGKWFNKSHAENGYIGGGISELSIGLPDNWIEQMAIANVEPHEDITCLGVGITPEIFIAYFSVSLISTD